MTFAGYTDRSRAEELRGTRLVLDSAEVGPSPDPEEFHDHELIGLSVQTLAGEPVGVVADVLHQGQDLLVIDPADGRPPPGGPAAARGLRAARARSWSRSWPPSCPRSMSRPGAW